MKLTQNQIVELHKIAATKKSGEVINLSCFGEEGKKNTRANMVQTILPDVETLIVLEENGKFSPLTQQDKVDAVMKIFNNFWRTHLKYHSNKFEFVHSQDDFFTKETVERLKAYSKTFFEQRLDDATAERNSFKYKLSSETEVLRLKAMQAQFDRDLDKRVMQVTKNFNKHQKEQVGKKGYSFIQQLIANNLARLDDASTAAQPERELVFTFGG